MASPPESVQINAEEFSKDEKSFAAKLASILNNYLLTTADIFNKKLTFGDNFSGDTPTVRVTGGKPITFKYQGPGTPRFLAIGQYRPVSHPNEVFTNPVSLPYWTYDGRGNITIVAIPGFTSNHTYDIMLTITTG